MGFIARICAFCIALSDLPRYAIAYWASFGDGDGGRAFDSWVLYAFDRNVRLEGGWSEGQWLTVMALALMGVGDLVFFFTDLQCNLNQLREYSSSRSHHWRVRNCCGHACGPIRSNARTHARMPRGYCPSPRFGSLAKPKCLPFGSRSPFHPLTERGLAPVWANSPVVNVTFWIATMLITAISTGYGMVIARFYKTEGWTTLVAWWSDCFCVWCLDGFCMGTAAPVPSLPSMPPFFPSTILCGVRACL